MRNKREQPVETAPLRRGRLNGVFYGWWIVAGATAASMVQSALYYNGFGVFFLPLLREFKASSVAVSGAVSLARLETGMLGPVGGLLVDKLGPRKIMVAGIALMGGSFLVLSQLHSLILFYVVFVFGIAMGASLGFGNASMTAVGNWFVRRRSLAFGIVVSGVGLGGPLTAALGWLISIYGWRPAAFAAGLLIWAVGFPIAAIMRHRPEDHGLLPDGRAIERTADAGDSRLEEGDFTARQALRTPAFWLMSGSFALRVMVTGAVGIHLVPYVVSLGISETTGALLLGAIAVLSMAGRLGFGVIGDHFPKRYVVAVGTAALLASCLVAATATTLWQVVLFVLLYSPAYGGLAMMMHSMRGEYFGRRAFGTIQGFMGTVMMFGTMAGPLYAAWVYDTTGLYRVAFFSFAVLLGVAVAAVLLAKRPVPTASGMRPEAGVSLPRP